MFITAKFLQTSAAFAVSSIAGAISTTVPISSQNAILSAMAIAAASAGSASAIIFVMIDNSARTGSIGKRVLKHILSFIMGTIFGLFVGPSIASFSPLDRLAGVYIGGLMGFGIIGALVSPDATRKLAEWIIEKITGKGDK